MGKKYKGKACAYCGRSSTCGSDHVVAREFFLREHRGNLPQVPACATCNGQKSSLEHYLTALLPFGGRHASSHANLEQVPKRLSKNQRLHRELARGQEQVWATDDSGLVVPMMTLPVDQRKLLDLFKWITRGLIWFHWQVRLTAQHDVTPTTLTRTNEQVFERLFALNAAAHVEQDLGDGTFWYQGAQTGDDPSATIWRFSPLGGIQFGQAAVPGEVARRIGAITGPLSMKDLAECAGLVRRSPTVTP